ncbi:MAG TPA: hypothetical protein DCY35_05020, partial [Prolixibacteraceae bacterium]|nr:hypothetical protein [Prolixibacteraceae bacterium]
MSRMAEDKLVPLGSGDIKIEGYLGEQIDLCIKNGIMAAEYPLYIEPFRAKTDEGGSWGGEFWGKWYTSAVPAYHYKPIPEFKEIIDNAVNGLMATQEENGRVSSSKTDFKSWDIWGRKYALLGMLAYYEQTGDKQVLHAAERAVDALVDVAGPGKTKLTETGLSVLEALSSSSILEPLALLCRYSEDRKYLEFARYIVSLLSEPNTFTSKGMRLIEDALDGVDPVKISAPKGYEMMSCYEGLCELYRVTGEEKLLDAAIRFAKKVLEKEIMIVGSGSSAELWCDGANRQTELL